MLPFEQAYPRLPPGAPTVGAFGAAGVPASARKKLMPSAPDCTPV